MNPSDLLIIIGFNFSKLVILLSGLLQSDSSGMVELF